MVTAQILILDKINVIIFVMTFYKIVKDRVTDCRSCHFTKSPNRNLILQPHSRPVCIAGRMSLKIRIHVCLQGADIELSPRSYIAMH